MKKLFNSHQQPVFNLKRLTALAILTAFVSTNHFTLPAYASTSTSVATGKSFPDDLNSVTLPESMGTVQEVYKGSSPQKVVLVQDAHAIPDAQRSIEKIIGHFKRQYGLPLIALEGASEELDARFFKSFPDKKLLARIFNEYYDNGELTGPVASAIFSGEDENAVYHGIEDWDLYEEGLIFYLRAAQKQGGILEQLNNFKQTVQKQKETVYSGNLLRLDGAISDFETSHGFAGLLKELAKTRVPEKGSELALLYGEILAQEKNQAALTHEVKKFAGEIAGQLKAKRSNSPSFNQKFQEFQTSQISAESFAAFLHGLAQKEKLQAEAPDSLKKTIRNQNRLQAIEGTQLFRDLEKYVLDVKNSLFRNGQEKKLDRISRQTLLLEKLIRLELGFDNWAELKGLLKEGPPEFKAILPKLDFHLDFYRNTEKRDRAFFDNLTALMKKKKAASSLLVAGGFHTEGITRQLKEKGISYILVMPKISSIPAENSYTKHMAGEVSWKNYFEIENGKIDLYKAFTRATRDKLLAHSGQRIADRKSKNDFLNAERSTLNAGFLKQWRDQIIKDLARTGQIERAGEHTFFLDEAGKTVALPKWRADVERFLENFRKLAADKQLTEQNVLKLFQTATFAELANGAGGTLQRVKVAAYLLPWVEEKKFKRSEIRGHVPYAPYEESYGVYERDAIQIGIESAYQKIQGREEAPYAIIFKLDGKQLAYTSLMNKRDPISGPAPESYSSEPVYGASHYEIFVSIADWLGGTKVAIVDVRKVPAKRLPLPVVALPSDTNGRVHLNGHTETNGALLRENPVARSEMRGPGFPKNPEEPDFRQFSLPEFPGRTFTVLSGEIGGDLIKSFQLEIVQFFSKINNGTAILVEKSGLQRDFLTLSRLNGGAAFFFDPVASDDDAVNRQLLDYFLKAVPEVKDIFFVINGRHRAIFGQTSIPEEKRLSDEEVAQLIIKQTELPEPRSQVADSKNDEYGSFWPYFIALPVLGLVLNFLIFMVASGGNIMNWGVKQWLVFTVVLPAIIISLAHFLKHCLQGAPLLLAPLFFFVGTINLLTLGFMSLAGIEIGYWGRLLTPALFSYPAAAAFWPVKLGVEWLARKTKESKPAGPRSELRALDPSDLQVEQKEKVIALHAPEDQGHLRLFEVITAELGKKMGRSGENLKALRVAGLLHETGRIGIDYGYRNRFVAFAQRLGLNLSRTGLIREGKLRQGASEEEYLDYLGRAVYLTMGQVRRNDIVAYAQLEEQRVDLEIGIDGQLPLALRETLLRFMTHDDKTLEVIDELQRKDKLPFSVSGRTRQVLQALTDLKKSSFTVFSGDILTDALILLTADQIALSNDEERRKVTRFKDWTRLHFANGFRNTLGEIDKYVVDRHKDHEQIFKQAKIVREVAWDVLLEMPDNRALLSAISERRQPASIEKSEWEELRLGIQNRRQTGLIFSALRSEMRSNLKFPLPLTRENEKAAFPEGAVPDFAFNFNHWWKDTASRPFQMFARILDDEFAEFQKTGFNPADLLTDRDYRYLPGNRTVQYALYLIRKGILSGEKTGATAKSIKTYLQEAARQFSNHPEENPDSISSLEFFAANPGLLVRMLEFKYKEWRESVRKEFERRLRTGHYIPTPQKGAWPPKKELTAAQLMRLLPLLGFPVLGNEKIFLDAPQIYKAMETLDFDNIARQVARTAEPGRFRDNTAVFEIYYDASKGLTEAFSIDSARSEMRGATGPKSYAATYRLHFNGIQQALEPYIGSNIWVTLHVAEVRANWRTAANGSIRVKISKLVSVMKAVKPVQGMRPVVLKEKEHRFILHLSDVDAGNSTLPGLDAIVKDKKLVLGRDLPEAEVYAVYAIEESIGLWFKLKDKTTIALLKNGMPVSELKIPFKGYEGEDGVRSAEHVLQAVESQLKARRITSWEQIDAGTLKLILDDGNSLVVTPLGATEIPASTRSELRTSNLFEAAGDADLREIVLPGFEDRKILVMSGKHQAPEMLEQVQGKVIPWIKSPEDALFLLELEDPGIEPMEPEVLAAWNFAHKKQISIFQSVPHDRLWILQQMAQGDPDALKRNYAYSTFNQLYPVTDRIRAFEEQSEVDFGESAGQVGKLMAKLWNVPEKDVSEGLSDMRKKWRESRRDFLTGYLDFLDQHTPAVNEAGWQLLRYYLRKYPDKKRVFVYLGAEHRAILEDLKIPESRRLTDAQIEKVLIEDRAEGLKRVLNRSEMRAALGFPPRINDTRFSKELREGIPFDRFYYLFQRWWLPSWTSDSMLQPYAHFSHILNDTFKEFENKTFDQAIKYAAAIRDYTYIDYVLYLVRKDIIAGKTSGETAETIKPVLRIAAEKFDAKPPQHSLNVTQPIIFFAENPELLVKALTIQYNTWKETVKNEFETRLRKGNYIPLGEGGKWLNMTAASQKPLEKNEADFLTESQVDTVMNMLDFDEMALKVAQTVRRTYVLGRVSQTASFFIFYDPKKPFDAAFTFRPFEDVLEEVRKRMLEDLSALARSEVRKGKLDLLEDAMMIASIANIRAGLPGKWMPVLWSLIGALEALKQNPGLESPFGITNRNALDLLSQAREKENGILKTPAQVLASLKDDVAEGHTQQMKIMSLEDPSQVLLVFPADIEKGEREVAQKITAKFGPLKDLKFIYLSGEQRWTGINHIHTGTFYVLKSRIARSEIRDEQVGMFENAMLLAAAKGETQALAALFGGLLALAQNPALEFPHGIKDIRALGLLKEDHWKLYKLTKGLDGFLKIVNQKAGYDIPIKIKLISADQSHFPLEFTIRKNPGKQAVKEKIEAALGPVEELKFNLVGDVIYNVIHKGAYHFTFYVLKSRVGQKTEARSEIRDEHLDKLENALLFALTVREPNEQARTQTVASLASFFLSVAADEFPLEVKNEKAATFLATEAWRDYIFQDFESLLADIKDETYPERSIVFTSIDGTKQVKFHETPDRKVSDASFMAVLIRTFGAGRLKFAKFDHRPDRLRSFAPQVLSYYVLESLVPRSELRQQVAQAATSHGGQKFTFPSDNGRPQAELFVDGLGIPYKLTVGESSIFFPRSDTNGKFPASPEAATPLQVIGNLKNQFPDYASLLDKFEIRLGGSTAASRTVDFFRGIASAPRSEVRFMVQAGLNFIPEVEAAVTNAENNDRASAQAAYASILGINQPSLLRVEMTSDGFNSMSEAARQRFISTVAGSVRSSKFLAVQFHFPAARSEMRLDRKVWDLFQRERTGKNDPMRVIPAENGFFIAHSGMPENISLSGLKPALVVRSETGNGQFTELDPTRFAGQGGTVSPDNLPEVYAAGLSEVLGNKTAGMLARDKKLVFLRYLKDRSVLSPLALLTGWLAASKHAEVSA